MTYKSGNQFQFAKLVAIQWNDPQWDIPVKVHILNEKARSRARREFSDWEECFRRFDIGPEPANAKT